MVATYPRQVSAVFSQWTAAFLIFMWCSSGHPAPPYAEISGIYPHLAFFNDEDECGTGAVASWADRLWAITYGPHRPRESSDKLYEIDQNLNVTIRPESIGGTHANRMIHQESQQLFIGRYVIDARRNVRVIRPDAMFGRLTGNARHLADPAHLIYCATMEEGLYQIDVRSLHVAELFADEQIATGTHSALPGYHGKGLYSSQRRLVYANNGEHGETALKNPETPSGCLAEWNGTSTTWSVVRRNQFTEVTGPGGIRGKAGNADPLWSIGWDHRSLILMLLDGDQWQSFRLPKASHCYDGAHGWNTEWPRIRDIGEQDLLMTMHGMFWRFPRGFRSGNTAGIAPRSTYLKVIGDFCQWGGRVVFGCDDTARNEFLNSRKILRGNLATPGQSQSNLWFVDPQALDRFGPASGTGAVWLDETVQGNSVSEPFLFAGFERRALHLAHDTGTTIVFTLEKDARGDGHWTELRTATVPPHGYTWIGFEPGERGEWVRIRPDRDSSGTMAIFHFSNRDTRKDEADQLFAAFRGADEATSPGALLYARGDNQRTLVAATESGCYEMGADLRVARVENPDLHTWMKKNTEILRSPAQPENASMLLVDESGRRWRLPKGPGTASVGRVCREVCTERDLFNCQGTFFELPALNAGGFSKIRPIATHNRSIHDYCSYRGLLVMSGLGGDAEPDAAHIVRSEDKACTLWVGAVDDLWKFGKPRGRGGPWQHTAVQPGVPSDPYLMNGYDKKSLRILNDGQSTASVRIEIDVSGMDTWKCWKSVDVSPGRGEETVFPEGFQAYWIRFVADRDTVLTTDLEYR